MNKLQLVLELLKAVPSIVGAVKSVQGAFGPGAKHNQAKKAVVMAPFVIGGAPPALHAAASTLVDFTVGTLKVAGKLDPPKPASAR